MSPIIAENAQAHELHLDKNTLNIQPQHQAGAVLANWLQGVYSKHDNNTRIT